MKQTMKLQALLCLLLFAASVCRAQSVAFWNVENYFENQPHFRDKTRGIAKVVLSLADSAGCPPSAVGLCEVENEACMKALVRTPALRKYGYRYVHYDSPDHRGIDCALLWRSAGGICPGLGRLRTSRAVPIRDTSGFVLPTRSLLVVEFDSLSVVVCHLPSKRGGSPEADRRRLLALCTLAAVCDSLSSANSLTLADSGEFYPLKLAETGIFPQSGGGMGVNLAVHRPIMVVGDFNDTRTAVSDSIMSPMRELTSLRLERQGNSSAIAAAQAPGTIKFQGEWEQIDRAFVSPGLDATLRIAALPFLMEPDKKHGGVKPRRTFIGPRHNAGLSDHLPIIVSINLLYL
ncbi:MAG: hypothetical protein J5740_00655 [Bacteroidales bacterium]|nr:hypothetical protein [Bacteroidales bacterium]